MTNVLERLLTTLDVGLEAFAVCEVDRGFRLVFEPMDAVVIHYVLVGNGVLQVGNRAPVPFAPHSIMIVPPGRGQSLSPSAGRLREVEAGNNCAMLADGLVKFDAHEGAGDLLTICGTITATYSGAFGVFDALQEPLVEEFSSHKTFRLAFHTMLEELTSPGLGTRALSEALMKQCLVLLLRQHLANSGITSPLFAALQDQRLARAIAAVLERPFQAHTVASLAGVAGMSRSVFAERFSQMYGQGPIDFVQRTRMRHAAHLLSATDLPVKVVAASVGYGSRSHFSRTFRVAYGVDPKTYRTAQRRRQGNVPSPRGPCRRRERRGRWT